MPVLSYCYLTKGVESVCLHSLEYFEYLRMCVILPPLHLSSFLHDHSQKMEIFYCTDWSLQFCFMLIYWIWSYLQHDLVVSVSVVNVSTVAPGRAAVFFSSQCHTDAADRWHNLDKCFGFALPITLSSHIKWPKSNPVWFLPDMKARKPYDLNQTWKSEVVQFSVQETTRSTYLNWISLFLLQPFINIYENVK